ncbi:phage tailspike protein [Serratia entomophila]|uniref:phage tailspike protein n=1 Tax=Serratia entomophila TaxID=42906 RepID=UPI0021778155|nr:phage tailspike protein [Serratia entomophila]CAI1783391.1 Head binding [Serratia entomophila]
MADNVPKALVSMPTQPFTLARSFKAAANGTVYIGKVGMDPTIPENQQQVFVGVVPVPQPISINSGGFPVYNGQVSVFTTTGNHSMLVLDAEGAQQHYFPDISTVDPQSLLALLAGPNGSDYIGTKDGTLTATINRIDTTVNIPTQQAVARAENAAERAENAADEAEAVVDNDYTFADIAAGLAGTTSGEYFRVPQGVGADISFIYYLNNSGTAVPVAELVGKGAIENQKRQLWELATSVGEHFSRYESDIVLLNPNKSPLLTMHSADGDDKVIAANFYNQFDLTMPASSRTAIEVDKAAGRDLEKDIVYVNPLRQALLVDNSTDPKVYLYQDLVSRKLGSAYGFEGVANNDRPSFFNGYVNSLLRAKSSAIKNNSTSNVLSKILVTGDSWWDKPTLPVSLETKLKSTYGNGGSGWIDFINEELMPGIAVSMSGFTVLRNWQAPFNQGMFVSGKRITTTTAAGTVSVSGIEGQRIRIFYYDLNGSFRYNLNGGAFTTVTGTSTNTVKYVEVTAASFSGNTISIDTSVNTGGGTVVLFGVNPQLSSGKGVSIIKAGQAGAKTIDFVQVLQYIPSWASVLAPDSVLITLGTNDIIQSRDVLEYQQNLTSLIESWKAALPVSCGVNMLFPAHANRPASEGYPDYAPYEQAARDICDSHGVGFISGLDLFPDYNNGNALNLWVDKDHLNSNGADLFVVEYAIKKLMEI